MEYNLKNMYTIVIIGAGELGSRHLQGALKLKFPAIIEVLDMSLISLDKAKNRAKELDPNPNIQRLSFVSSINDISTFIDLCIIATTSNVRLSVIEEMLLERTVKNLILEKVLFQKIVEYEIVQKILDKKKINTWVNCPRRMMSVYQNIKAMIQPGEKLTFTAIGGNWGLACNAIHFIDTMSFLNENFDFEYNTSGLGEIVPAKRLGFYELTGSLIAKQNNGSELFLYSRAGNSAGIIIQILSDNFLWQINESNGILITSSAETGWIPELSNFEMPYQSILTDLICEDILIKNVCKLPSFEISSKLHQGMIKAFLKVFNRNELVISDSCPIT